MQQSKLCDFRTRCNSCNDVLSEKIAFRIRSKFVMALDKGYAVYKLVFCLCRRFSSYCINCTCINLCDSDDTRLMTKCQKYSKH